jgi:hypothetical protein
LEVGQHDNHAHAGDNGGVQPMITSGPTISQSATRTVCDNLDKYGGLAAAFAPRGPMFSRIESNRSVHKGRRTRTASVMTSVSRGTGRITTYEL